ncbi:MAG TPA: hypothetical protein VFW49_07245 [Fluviicoccus sp.]|nr:hypothetical protein [Fluviicoccus sp.]
MTSPVLTLACTSAKEQDRLVFKSLLGILAQTVRPGQARWDYLAEGYADVVFVDMDEATPVYPKSEPGKPLSVVVGYSTDLGKAQKSVFSLKKPARPKEFIALLTMLEEHLAHKNDLTIPSMPALNLA